jgi:hypothetical protein
MRHRHLNDDIGLTAAAIDDILDRGSLDDWLMLREAAKNDKAIADVIVHICRAHEMYGTSPLWIAMIDRIYGARR